MSNNTVAPALHLQNVDFTYLSTTTTPFLLSLPYLSSSSNPYASTSTGTVLIPVERLRELEALEAKLPKLIEDAIQENKKKNLKRLHEKDKSNPESVNLRVKRYAMRHKETLNARRREKREQAKKVLAEKTVQAPSDPSSIRASPEMSAPGSPVANLLTNNVITVRFDD